MRDSGGKISGIEHVSLNIQFIDDLYSLYFLSSYRSENTVIQCDYFDNEISRLVFTMPDRVLQNEVIF